MNQLPELRIGDNVIPLPIIQGGMGVGVSLSGLASAVANEGGIGVIASAGIGTFHFDWDQGTMSLMDLDREGLRLEIRKARSLTKGWIGVNIMAALNDFSSLLRVALEEGADFIFIGAGLPFWDTNEIPLEVIHRTKTKLVPIVSSAKAARLIFQYWDKKYGRVPDALVLEGPKAGGHLGFSLRQINNPDYQLENLIPQLVEQVKELETDYARQIPIIAGGGIFTGGDIRKALEMGVQGVQMSTRFVGTFECDASNRFKEAYLECQPEDITIINSGTSVAQSVHYRCGKRFEEAFRMSLSLLEHLRLRQRALLYRDGLNERPKRDLGRGVRLLRRECLPREKDRVGQGACPNN